MGALLANVAIDMANLDGIVCEFESDLIVSTIDISDWSLYARKAIRITLCRCSLDSTDSSVNCKPESDDYNGFSPWLTAVQPSFLATRIIALAMTGRAL